MWKMDMWKPHKVTELLGWEMEGPEQSQNHVERNANTDRLRALAIFVSEGKCEWDINTR